MIMDYQARLLKILSFAAKPHIVFYMMPWLMVLLVVGTLAQKEMGVYEATKTYFSSWFFFWGPLPLPGGFLTLGIIFVTLFVKFIFFSEWCFKKSGIILTHLGVLVLLFGGLLTAKFAQETFMIIPEGESVGTLSLYRERVVTIEKNGAILKTIDFENVKTGEISSNLLPFDASISFKCANCSMAFQDESKIEKAHGLAEKVTLTSIPLEKENETNLAGMMVNLDDASDNTNGHYLLMESVAETIEIPHQEDTYTIKLNRVQVPLDFSLYLEDFRKIRYPGTNEAKGYESDIIIYDDGVEWPVTIRMNEPARYKGYTFFQSSFVEQPGKDVTVLNVVHNIGHIFPYISCSIIFLGLFIQAGIRAYSLKDLKVKAT
ncbi:MAG: cytochrome c biogenesis protein ResB [Pseudomonadota bacterium]